MKNGALYYNTNANRVERVVGNLNGNRVFTVSHGYSDFGPVKRSSLRGASGEEVDSYLEESAAMKAPLANPVRALQVSLS